MAFKSFVFPRCPTNQISFNVLQKWIHSRFIISTIIIYPSLNIYIKHPRQVCNVLVTSQMYFPTSDLFAYLVCCQITDRWSKVDKCFTLFILGQSWTKCVPKKVKTLMFMRAFTIYIFTVNYLCLVCIQFKTTLF